MTELAGNDHHASELDILRVWLGKLESRLTADDEHAVISLEQISQILQAVLESCNDSIFVKDLQGRYLIVNSAAAELLGVKKSDVIGKTDHELMPAELASRFRENDQRVMQSGRPATYEEAVSQGGVNRIYLTTKTLLRDTDEQIIGVVGIARDITERKESENSLRRQLEQQVAETTEDLHTANRMVQQERTRLEEMDKQLRESQQQFRRVVDTIPVPIIITRVSDDHIVYANARFLEEFGTADSLIDRKSTEFYYDPEDRETLLEQLKYKGAVRDVELRVRRQDGSTGFVSVSQGLFVFGGELAVVAAFLDITARKRAEEGLRQERRLLRRSVDLHEREHKLTAYEIHDGIVQDMTGALMFIEAFLARSDQEVNLERSKQLIQRSIDEARRIINGLLPPVLEDHGIVAAIENLVAEIEASHGIKVEMTHRVNFDRLDSATEMAIYRIVQEGLNNVWQHSGSSKAAVRVIEELGQIRISIQDWGCGFDVAAVRRRKTFGLRGMRERAKQLGGGTYIHSEPNRGTTVHVGLPLRDIIDDDSWSHFG